jgi:hypothetical protein
MARPYLHIKEKRKGKGVTYATSATTALILQQDLLRQILSNL